jgi:nucleolar MIF4G domain-containing protein 1
VACCNNKPVDFTLLKPRTTNFLRDLFAQLFIATQVAAPVLGASVPTTRNRGVVEEVFIKAVRIDALALGLVYFLSKEMSRSRGEDGEGLVEWATGVALDTLRTGMDVIPNL